jgi:uncharacterized protein with HEPN domain
VSRDWLLYLEDMAGAAAKIIRFTRGMTFDEFVGDDVTYDAVLHNLLITGEAAKHVPGPVRARYGDVEWRKIAGLRDVLAHAYFGLEDETLWDVVHEKIPRLHEQLTAILDDVR